MSRADIERLAGSLGDAIAEQGKGHYCVWPDIVYDEASGEDYDYVETRASICFDGKLTLAPLVRAILQALKERVPDCLAGDCHSLAEGIMETDEVWREAIDHLLAD